LHWIAPARRTSIVGLAEGMLQRGVEIELKQLGIEL
jgi:hypothetical protein